MQRPNTAEIPDAPGAYLWRDVHGQVMYVGKAKSLRKRGHDVLWQRPGSSNSGNGRCVGFGRVDRHRN